MPTPGCLFAGCSAHCTSMKPFMLRDAAFVVLLPIVVLLLIIATA
ncbi:MAG: hypothetical protein ACJ79J_10830 [Gemmatimonadaceae bacterium]